MATVTWRVVPGKGSWKDMKFWEEVGTDRRQAYVTDGETVYHARNYPKKTIITLTTEVKLLFPPEKR